MKKFGFWGRSGIVKTFERPDMLQRFMISIVEYQRSRRVSFGEVLICDDSDEVNQDKNAEYLKSVAADLGSTQVRHLREEFDIGLSKGRNILTAAAASDVILLCDDDFILDPDSDISESLNSLNEGDFHILGGWLTNNYNPAFPK